MDSVKINMLSVLDKLWAKSRDNIDEIRDFLSTGFPSKNMDVIIHDSLKQVVGEFIVNEEEYKKYPIIELEDEDFVDMVIESIATKIPEIHDIEENDKYIREFREIIWGCIKKYINEANLLFTNFYNKEYVLTKTDMELLMRCVTVVFVETVLRKREIQLLEYDKYREN